uniref:FYVE-type domain-containing protein n=1 Tax=Hyaloperonospora arabidopsidis (strain Emoy2) TaxID=559515 RepID=M4BG10_HYAAE
MSLSSGHLESFRSGPQSRVSVSVGKDLSSKLHPPPQEQLGDGLTIVGSQGQTNVVFTEQQMTDDLLAAVPKLHAVISKEARESSRWHRKSRKDGVTTYGSVPNTSGSDDSDLAYASLAKTKIKCHLNEVLNVLVSHESSAYQSTMAALCGDKFQDGHVAYQQRCQFSENSHRVLSGVTDSPLKGTEEHDVLLSVNMATLQPTLPMRFQSKKHRQPQKLCFSSLTHQYVSKDRAVHVMKTLPKHVHDALVPPSQRTALRDNLDHLTIGFDIQSTPTSGGSSSQTTRIVAHGYAAVTAPEAFGAVTSDSPQSKIGASNREQVTRRRGAMMNPEAKHVLELLTRSLREFERVIRRRRLGFQSFVYFLTVVRDEAEMKSCHVCTKGFSLLRRDFFCQLCGHMVCRNCSHLHEVEASIGEVRRNRICVKCVVRVDACTFEDDNLAVALGPTVVSDEQWFTDSERESLDDGSDVVSVTSTPSDSSLSSAMSHDRLTSSDPATRSQALEELGRLVIPNVTGSLRTKRRRKVDEGKDGSTDLAEMVKQDVEHHLKQSLRVAEKEMKVEDCEVAGLDRDYAFEFDGDGTYDPNHPLPPMPPQEKEDRRLQYIDESGVLASTFDRAALDLLAQVAAKQLNCPIGFVTMVGKEVMHAVGAFPPRPRETTVIPRGESICAHTVYADKPLVVKNPQRDMRFAQMSLLKKANMKFYAGFPIRAPDGSVVALLCASDFKPHETISTKEYATMETLAKLAGQVVAPRQLAIAVN